MADRYPTYQNTVAVAAPQRVDYANFQEEARGAAQSAQTWDRMGQWFERIGTERAKVEGEIYQAKNPVTLQQISDAKAQGQDIADLVPNGISVFDRARRKTAVDQITNEMEIQARRQMTDIALKAEENKTPSADVMKQIQSVIDGYSSTLGEVAPEGLKQFRASSSIIGNSMYMKAASDELQRFKKNREVEANLAMADITQALPGLIAAGDTVDPVSGKTVSIDDRVSVMRETTIKRIAKMTEDPEAARRYIEGFDKAVTGAKISAVEKYVTHPDFISNPSVNLRRLETGDLGSVSAVYRSLKAEDQAKVAAAFMRSAGDRYTLLSQSQTQQDRAERIQANTLLTAYSQLPSTDEKGRADLINKLSGLKTVDPMIAIKLRDEQGSGTDSEPYKFQVRALIETRQITTPDQLWAHVGMKQISADTAIKLFPQIEAFNEKDVQEASSMFYRHFGIPADKIQMKMDPTAQTRQVAMLTQKMMTERVAAQRSGTPFDPIAFAGDQIDKLAKKSESDPMAKAAKDYIRQIEADIRAKTGRVVSIRTAEQVDELKKLDIIKSKEAAPLYLKLKALEQYGVEWQ
jgi:hypothetical protein